jgi:hypothetical protein
MQRYINHLFLQNVLHVSGGSTVHHQAFKTAHKTSGFFFEKTRCCMYSLERLMMGGGSA